MENTPRIYLAGPEVFLPNPIEIADQKKRICENYGLKGVFPLDTEIEGLVPGEPESGYKISVANEELIRSCQGVIANMTPFRGPSADVGTAYEMGFAKALGLAVFAYTNSMCPFIYRVIGDQTIGAKKDEAGVYRDFYKMSVEDFGLHDNLMLEGGIVNSGGSLSTWQPANDFDKFQNLIGFELAAIEAGKFFNGSKD
jgi:nucleoside 2-deoxyribosyltransferase